ncbi:hypothetical protein D9M68_793130 [compost metagenome]
MNIATGEGRCSGKVTDTIGCSCGRLKRSPLTTLRRSPASLSRRYRSWTLSNGIQFSFTTIIATSSTAATPEAEIPNVAIIMRCNSSFERHNSSSASYLAFNRFHASLSIMKGKGRCRSAIRCPRRAGVNSFTSATAIIRLRGPVPGACAPASAVARRTAIPSLSS